MKRLLWGLPALLLAGCAAGLYALLHTTAGALWLLARVPGLEVRGATGALLGEFHADAITIELPTRDRVQLEGLQWQGLQLSLLQREVTVEALTARRVHVHIAPSTEPIPAPADLRLPVRLDIQRLHLEHLQLDSVGLDGVDARLHLGADQHRLQLLAVRWQGLRAEGELSVGAAAPVATRLSLSLRGQDGIDWRGQVQAQGPLADLSAQAQLEAQGQSLQAQARLLPFARRPLAALDLTTRQLNLAALHPELPHTGLTGQAQLVPENTLLRLRLHLANALPGRWDAQRLPIHQLRADLLGDPGQLTALRIDALRAELPGGARLQGQARAGADGAWQLEAQAQGLQPELLDQHLPRARLSGPLALAGGAGQPLNLTLDLAGTLASSAPLRLRAALRHAGPVWHLDQAEIQAGSARAAAEGQFLPAGAAEPSRLALTLTDFDPSLLWQGGLPAMRLNGEAKATLRGLAGELQAELTHSQLAGLPLAARLRARRTKAGDPFEHQADISLGSNRLQSSGLIERQHFDGHLRLQAPAMAELAQAFKAAPFAGSAELDTDLRLGPDTQRWQARGQGQARGLAVGKEIKLDALQARWSLPELASNEPVQLDLQLQGLSHPHASLKSLSAQAQGPWAAHRGEVALDASLPLPRGEPIAFKGQSEFAGRWDGRAWQGRVGALVVKLLRGDLPELLEARNLDLRASADEAVFAPGSVQLAGARLNWQTLSWRPGQLQADVRLEPLAVAPLLARWQPEFGWGGDLTVGGSANLRWTAPRLDADLLIERTGGDLSVTDEFGPQRLGLSELRLAASAHDGVWRFGQGLAGTNLGTFAAAQTLFASGALPDAQSRLEGLLQARVENLANWGSWVPAGWRLAGKLSAAAQLGGRLGAPEWRGSAEGQDLALRHPLFGVDVSEGAFLASLDGPRARLTSLDARAGDGHLHASGEAEFGETPSARLQLTAEKLRVLGRADRRLVASGDARLQLAAQSLQLTGKLRADEGLVDFSRADAPSLGDDVMVQRGPAKALATKPASTLKTRVDVDLDFGDAFKVVGRGLKTDLRGALKLEQRDSKLSVTGKLQAQGGEYAAYGQKLDIERGDLSFNGPFDNPSLDLLATRPNTDTRVGVRVTGSALSPRVALFSEPELPETDKLAWLLLGRGPDGLGRTDTALLQRAALALLSGEGESATGKVLRGLGLDELSLAQSDDDTRATIVRLGKQLSRRWYVGYERSLNATTGSWQLIYRIAQRFTLRAQGGDDNALDLIWQWRWE